MSSIIPTLRERGQFYCVRWPIAVRRSLSHLVTARWVRMAKAAADAWQQERGGPLENGFRRSQKYRRCRHGSGDREQNKLQADHVRAVDPVSEHITNRKVGRVQTTGRPVA